MTKVSHITGKKLGGVLKFRMKMGKKMEKIWVGVQILSGKNPKYGKNLVVGVILGQFGKIYHTFPGYFPDPPPVSLRKYILMPTISENTKAKATVP